MNSVAIASQLFVLAVAIAALFFCADLFRRSRQFGWLLIAALFAEPIVSAIIRVCRGRSLVRHATTIGGSDGILHTTQHFEFPVFYFIAVLGLFFLARCLRRESSNKTLHATAAPPGS